MANKDRPKKTRGLHYRRYVYGEAAVRLKKMEEIRQRRNGKMWDEYSDDDELTADVQQDIPVFNEDWYGESWPKSGFQKVDVLKVSLALKKGLKVIPPWKDQYYEQRRINKRREIEGMRLPFELIMKIIRYTDKKERPVQLRICKAVYWSLLEEVYYCPLLDSINFPLFVDTILDKRNKKRFAYYVKLLDLSNIIQSGKNSCVAKLLHRFSPALEVFISSQASFGIQCLISLRSCHKLKVLDLNLVSETVNLKELFRSLHALDQLEQLMFPRSSITCEEFEMEWPPNLWLLKLQGGITNEFIEKTNFPSTITNLEFAHCPSITDDAITDLLGRIGCQLHRLCVHYPMPMLSPTAFDSSLLYCPNLRVFYTSISYVSSELFGDNFLPRLEDRDRPLQSIIIDSAGQLGLGTKMHPDDITIAVLENRLPCLKTLSLSSLLGWDFDSHSVQDLVGEMEWRNGEVYKL